MKFWEACGMMWRAHAQNVVAEIARIEAAGLAQGWSEEEVRRQQEVVFELGAREWARRGWVTCEHFLADNVNSRLAVASEGGEFSAGARLPHRSGREQSKGRLS